MNPRSRRTRARNALAVVALLVATGCTAEEQLFMTALVRYNESKLEARLASVQGSLSDEQLARLARCESGGNPRIVSKSGKYHGLYQFDQRTWNGVASRIAPEYVGIRPSAAPPEVQHAMARGLYSQRGRSPWPVCGRRM